MARSLSLGWAAAQPRSGDLAPRSVEPLRRVIASMTGRLEQGPPWLGPAVLLVLAVPFFFLGLGTSRLFRTEGHRAEAGLEMLRARQFLYGRLYGRPFVTKPPLGYWAIAASDWVLGEATERSARLPSALAATASVLLLFWIVARSFGRTAGLAAAVAAMASYTWIDKSTSADLEMMLIGWVTASLALFYRGFDDPADRGWPWTLGASVCLAAGFLTKGPAALMFFYPTVLCFALVQRRWRALVRWEHWVGLAILLLVCGGWAAALVHAVGVAVVRDTLAADVPRPWDAQHWRLLGSLAHPLITLAAYLPWSLFGLLALARPFRAGLSDSQRRLLSFLLCWIGASIAAWSPLPSVGRATRYMYPMFPAMAALAGITWSAWFAGRQPRWWDRLHAAAAVASMALPGLTVTAAGVYVAMALPVYRVISIALAIAAAGLGVLGWRAARADLRPAILAAAAGLWLTFKVGFVEIVLPERTVYHPLAAYGRAIGQRLPDGAPLHVFHDWPPSMLFYARHPIVQQVRPDRITSAGGPQFWLLSAAEWARWSGRVRVQRADHLEDMRGHAIIVAHVAATDRAARP